MKLKNEDGISGNIGIMLIITVAVIGVAVVGVTVTSQDTPDEIPNVDIIIGCDQCNATHYNITLFHNGGDTISENEFEIQAFNADGEEITVTSCSGSSDNVWSIGDTTTFFADDEPVSIKIMYTTGSAAAMLKSLDLGMPGDEEEVPPDVFVDETGTLTPTVTPTPTPTPGADAGTIYFYREGNNHVTQSGSITFTVTGTPAHVLVRSGQGGGGGSTKFGADLLAEDQITFDFGSGSSAQSKYITIEGIGALLYAEVSKADTTISGSQSYSDNRWITDINLASYEVDASSYEISSTINGQGQEPYTLLTIGENVIINENNNEGIRIVNARPVPGSVSILDTSGRGHWGVTLFIGDADEVWRGGVKIYPGS